MSVMKMNTISPKRSYDLVISDALWHIRCNIRSIVTATLLRHTCACLYIWPSACACIGGQGVSNRTMSVCSRCGCNVQYAKELSAAAFSITVAGGLMHRDTLAHVLCIVNACL